MATASQPRSPRKRSRAQGKLPWRVIFRCLLLLATAVSLYLLFPSLVDVFTQWRSLGELDPLWILARRRLRGGERHLALGDAADRAARAELVRRRDGAARRQRRRQRHPRRRPRPPARSRTGCSSAPACARDDVAGGLAAVSLANTATILACRCSRCRRSSAASRRRAACSRPPTSAPARSRRDSRRARRLRLGRAAAHVGRAVAPSSALFPGKRERTAAGERLSGAAGRIASCVRRAVAASRSAPTSASPASTTSASSAASPRSAPGRIRRSSLLAYCGAMLLALIPFTPGGLGFVEAGLTGLLTLAGTSAGTRPSSRRSPTG